jgi:serine/threonine protein kinase/tetratricopeptide (TPR) repeat protein
VATNGLDEQAIFEVARKMDNCEARETYLRQVCGQDEALIGRVRALLQAHKENESFLEGPASALREEPGRTVDQPAAEGPGTVIGPYKLLQEIGEGGMGSVWMAQQTKPVKRLVALKLIKAGMDSRQVIARFEAERQALALMDHANIARVLDGGTTSAGRPYFVMDLVKGVSITRYCDEHHLTPRQRLELFLPVCQAIQHAHQKGIIHRDLKPSNVLVALYDGKAVPKVIDFGVAKAAGQSLTDKTLVTGFGNIVGTLEYMSPEQAEINQLDIDTRSDIYSLGVLLYELLTGSPPFTRKELEKAGMLEMLRVIREQEPSKPSTKLSTAEGLPTLAANRGTEPAKLTKLVRGELDWIVMKALEKDRNRRYETANGFAADVQRYLADEPVQACPPSALYRFRKFARRNKARLAITGLLLFFLVSLGGGAGWMAKQHWARQRETERAVTTALAQAEALLAEGDLQTDDPARWQAIARLARSSVERAEELAATGEPTEDLAERIRRVRAEVEGAQTDSRLLAELDRIRLEHAAVEESHFDYAGAVLRYAAALRSYGVDSSRPREAAARVRNSRLRRALLAALDEWRRFARDRAEKQRLEDLLSAVEPDPTAFQARWRAAVQRQDRAALVKLADEPEALVVPAATVANLARDLWGVNQAAAAERVLRAGQERYPSDFWLNQNLGLLLAWQKPPRGEEAVRYLTAALALRSDSPVAHLNLGNALAINGDIEGAIRRFRAVLRIDPRYADAHYNLGNALTAKGRLDEAIAEFQETVHLKMDYAVAHYSLGCALATKGQLDEAIAAYRAAIRHKPDYAEAHCNLGNALKAKGQMDEAIAAYRKAIRLKKDLPEAHYNLGCALATKGQLDKAIAAYRAAIRLKPDYAEAHCNLGDALLSQGQFTQALAFLRRGHEFGSRNPGWPYPSAQWVRTAERLVALEGQLPDLLSGKKQPADTADRLALSRYCHSHKKHYAAAVRFFAEALAAEPSLLGGQPSDLRYDAACAAALSGCGQGEDAKSLDDKERVRLRRQALDWLRADLAAWRRLLENEPAKASPALVQKMQQWQSDPDFAGVRGPEALRHLPPAECPAWQELWKEVEQLRERGAGLRGP